MRVDERRREVEPAVVVVDGAHNSEIGICVLLIVIVADSRRRRRPIESHDYSSTRPQLEHLRHARQSYSRARSMTRSIEWPRRFLLRVQS